MTPDPFKLFSLRIWMVAMWSQIFFWSFSRTPHFLHYSRACSISRPVNSDRVAVAALFR